VDLRFQLSINGRVWVSTEATRAEYRESCNEVCDATDNDPKHVRILNVHGGTQYQFSVAKVQCSADKWLTIDNSSGSIPVGRSARKS